jgi:hypothetical protein
MDPEELSPLAGEKRRTRLLPDCTLQLFFLAMKRELYLVSFVG